MDGQIVTQSGQFPTIDAATRNPRAENFAEAVYAGNDRSYRTF